MVPGSWGRSFASLAVMIVLGAGVARADEAAKDAAARPVEKVVVTAQKREQQVQDVPISITTVGGGLFRDTGARDIKDLQILVPGMTVTSTGSDGSTTARLRGVGTVGDNPGLESSVAVVIDGVYRPRNSVGFGDLGEVSRIEILKGPQSSVFGKNTSAGVINILTALPEHEFGADLEATVGNLEAWGGSFAVTGELGDESLTGRFYGALRRRDGYYDVITGQGPRGDDTDSNQHYETARAQLMWEPSDDFTLRFLADITDRDEMCCVGVGVSHRNATSFTTTRGDYVAQLLNIVAPGSTALTADGTPDGVAYANYMTDQQLLDRGVSLQADWETGFGATLTAITALRDWDQKRAADWDYTAADIQRMPNDGNNGASFQQFSEEVRLTGSSDVFDWLIGGFYARERLDFRTSVTTGGLSSLGGGLTQQEEYYARRFFGTTSFAAYDPIAFSGLQFTPFIGTEDRHQQDMDSFALFTNETLRLFSDRAELTLGLRYTHEEKEMRSHYDNQGVNDVCANMRANYAAGQVISNDPWFQAANVVGGESGTTRLATLVGTVCSPSFDPIYDDVANFQSETENELTGSLKASWRFDDDLMTYVSYARGHKAGGFNLDRERSGTALAPTIDFDTRFPAEIVNAYELGAKTSWLDGTVLVNAALFHQVYTDFQLNTFTGTQFIVTPIPKVVSDGIEADFVLFAPVRGLTLQGGAIYAETEYGDFSAAAASVPARLPGSRISFGPLYSATLAATYQRPIGDGLVMRTALAGKYSSEYNTGSDLNPFKMQPEYVVLNARLALAAEDGAWDIELWSQNLLDEDIIQVAFDAPGQSDVVDAFMAPPRTIGLTLRTHH